MHVRRTILCLAAIFFWAAHDPDMASGQSSELMEAYNSYKTLYQQGRYSEAEPYAKEALRLGIEEFGPNDPTTATLLNNLALLYKAQGHYADAEPLYQRSLAIREKALGPEHPDVATSINNLALLYQAQGRYAEAESLFRRSLAIREKVFGTVAELVATTESAKLEAGVFFQAHIIKPPNLPPHKVWIYHPDPLPSNRMPLVVIPPAGGRFFSAPDLVLGDRPEHLPYVRAGFAVVSFNMQGAAPSDASNSELLMAASAFRAGQAGIENARSALGCFGVVCQFNSALSRENSESTLTLPLPPRQPAGA